MSFRSAIAPGAPLRGVTLAYMGAPPVPADEVETLVATAAEQARQAAETQAAAEIQTYKGGCEEAWNRQFDVIQKRYDDLVDEVHARLPALLVAGLRRLFPQISLEGTAVEALILETAKGLIDKGEAIEVRLSPADYATFQAALPQFQQKHPRIQVTEDGELQPADCRVLSRFGEIDARMTEKLSRIEEELTDE